MIESSYYQPVIMTRVAKKKKDLCLPKTKQQQQNPIYVSDNHNLKQSALAANLLQTLQRALVHALGHPVT